MSSKARKGLEDGPTAEEPTENHRVTARIVRESDGSRRTIYSVDGYDVGSIDALQEALGGRR